MIIKRIIINNSDLSDSFDITMKKRKFDSRCEDVTYTWKKNKYVQFKSEKRARLFLIESVIM